MTVVPIIQKQSKSMDWFLFYRDLVHERVNESINGIYRSQLVRQIIMPCFVWESTYIRSVVDEI